jgi:hypothetical protein
MPRLSSPFFAETRPEHRRAGGVDGHGAQGKQRAEFSGPGSVNSGFPWSGNRRQDASVLLPGDAWAGKTASKMPATKWLRRAAGRSLGLFVIHR